MNHSSFIKPGILGHPSALFVLFFTEMWERFSFYGMRVLLINFLTYPLISDNPGWQWSPQKAAALYGTYAMLLYITPIAGGIIADRFTGYRAAVIIGALIMTLGHAAMAAETEVMLYVGLGLLVIGTGFFKPNITSIVSDIYLDKPEKKDGAYTIFYMGINAGAFFGMMLCGYLAERIGWRFGFGLAGIFMLLGTLQFWLSKPLFDSTNSAVSNQNINQKSSTQQSTDSIKNTENNTEKNPYSKFDKLMVVICVAIGLAYAFYDPIYYIADINLFPFAWLGIQGQYLVVLLGLAIFAYLIISRLSRMPIIERNRIIAVIIFAFFTVFFWMSFEQGASSLVIFARDSVDRTITGQAQFIFNLVNAAITIIPLVIVSWVLLLLIKQTFKQILFSNISLILCFGIVWLLVIWMLKREFQTDESEITVAWFSILNSLFIIMFASLFSKWWDSKHNPSAPAKYALGLIIMAIGFGCLAYGAYGIEAGIKVSMIWLILAYLFHTLGELCISPVGLSYVSKLVSPRIISFMFGMWFLAIAIGNKLAAVLGGEIDNITQQYSLSVFFLIFTIVPLVAGILIYLLKPLLNKLMHGVK